MSGRIVKGLVLGILLITGTGATWPPQCSMGCSPRTAEVVLQEIQPPSGPISTDTVTLTVTGTEEHSASAAYAISAWLDRWNPQAASWQSTNQHASWQYGTWSQNGTCTEIRDVTIRFESVPLTAGENKFRIQVMVDGWDGMEDQWVYREVTYTH